MKFLKECVIVIICFTCIGFGGAAFFKMQFNSQLEEDVKSSEAFFLDGKQHHCGLTPEQVDVDAKQNELDRAKEKRHGR